MVAVCCEGGGNQPVLGIAAHGAALRQIGFVLGALRLLVTQTVGFFDAGLEFALHCQAHLNGKRVERFDEQLANGLVDASPMDALADRFGLLDAFALADVLGTQAAPAAVVTNRHAVPASTTDHDSLKKCWTLTRRTSAPVGSNHLCALMQTLLILLILFPRQIPCVRNPCVSACQLQSSPDPHRLLRLPSSPTDADGPASRTAVSGSPDCG